MREKPLLALALALLSGLFFGEAFSFFPITLSCFVLILLFLEAWFFQSRLISISLLAVWALGFLLHQFGPVPQAKRDLKKYLNQGEHYVIAEVTAPPRPGKNKVSFRMKVLGMQSDKVSPHFQAVSGVFQLLVWEKNLPFEYGDQLKMKVKLRSPKQYQNPGSFLYADYRERTGWQATANLSSQHQIKKVGEGGNALLKIIYGFREDIRKKILRAMDEQTAPILLAMVIGESGNLSDEMREDFISAGIAHLLAVSGTHLAFIAVFVFFCTRTLMCHMPETLLLKWTTRKIPAQWAALMTAFVVTFYAFLAGGRIGTLRALIMVLIYLLSIWLGRSRDTLSSLALAALLILLVQPRALFEISFQLSFLAVLSILLFMTWWEKTSQKMPTIDLLESPLRILTKKWGRALKLLFLSSLGASIGTAPLTLYYFHQWTWVGLFSNLLLVPIAGWILLPFALVSAVVSLFIPEFPLAAWHAGLWGIFRQLVQGFAAFPGVETHFASPSLWLIFSFYACFFFLLVTQKSRKTLFASLGVFFMIFIVWGIFRLPPKDLRVTFLDVGQGDAALVEFPDGKTLLIDGGDRRAGKYALAPYLWQRRIQKIDLLIVSHPQSDHIGGLPFILQNFKVDTVLTTEVKPESDIHLKFQKALHQAGVKRRILGPTTSELKIAGCQLFFLPAFETRPSRRNDFNNRSIVFKLQCPQKGEEAISFLFTGDIEAERERQLLASKSALQSTVLKVPHHGSRSSSQADFIAAVSPRIVLFSVGQKNRYRHPNAKVVKRYEKAKSLLLRTDQVGAVMIHVGKKTRVSTFFEKKWKRVIWNKRIFIQEWGNIRKVFRDFG